MDDRVRGVGARGLRDKRGGSRVEVEAALGGRAWRGAGPSMVTQDVGSPMRLGSRLPRPPTRPGEDTDGA